MPHLGGPTQASAGGLLFRRASRRTGALLDHRWQLGVAARLPHTRGTLRRTARLASGIGVRLLERLGQCRVAAEAMTPISLPRLRAVAAPPTAPRLGSGQRKSSRRRIVYPAASCEGAAGYRFAITHMSGNLTRTLDGSSSMRVKPAIISRTSSVVSTPFACAAPLVASAVSR